MNQLFLLFTLLVFGVGYSQTRYDIPKIDNPNLPNSYLLPNSKFESLQSAHLVKTTESFELYGDVKSIKETITSKQSEGNPIQTITYRFLENNRLLTYAEDTLNSFINSNSRVDEYTYDSTHMQLIKAEHWNGRVGINSKNIVIFDTAGYVKQENFEKYQTGSWSDKEYDKNIFDYTLTYDWNKNRDTVQLNYRYKKAETHYQRYSNRQYTFNKEKQESLKHTDQIHQIQIQPISSIFTEYQVKRDRKGNITKWTIIDNTIKGSFNIDQRYEFQYNPENALIKVSYSTSGRQREFTLNYTYEIDYQQYDENGNWTVKTVTSTKGESKLEYRYEREVSYY